MKPKREITLGEMQDECKKHTVVEKNGSRVTNCSTCDPVIMSVCKDIGRFSENTFIIPGSWNLTDPPRFTEAQMAFLRGCYEVGIVGLLRNGDNVRLHFLTAHGTIGYIHDMGLMIPIKVGETLDLAELFGKEGTIDQYGTKKTIPPQP